ncbi:hypothetical protein B0T17DRAFT_507725 [Bombardia bombarda]|uniref:Casein kinase II beta 2 subunit n=1 Tax=Bombardia bombarda TaxID=252184 RepID=A0AA40C4E0_9PEZI|nr:hypothetical protein B0T17DRAFT_507725 [Bombardia bombarda]
MSPSAGGFWATAALRVLGKNLARTSKLLRSKLAAASRPAAGELQAIPIRSNNTRQPIHPVAALRQQKRNSAKWFSTGRNAYTGTVRRYLSNAASGPSSSSPRIDRSKFPISNTSRSVAQLTGRAPFASTLRPNLTGGALSRTAGGYAAPGAGRAGSARYFSHTPAAPAQVVQNVSQAMRAFWLSGQRARYDGVGASGDKRYVAVSAAHDDARIRLSRGIPKNALGAFIDFHVSPTITALSPLGGGAFPAAAAKGEEATLHAEGFLDVLSIDFARALKDLAAIMTDLKHLSGLGDLPISLERSENNAISLRVRFPGVDAETVERLCDDVGVQRGVVGQDLGFEESAGVPVALRFPYAPDDEMKTITSPGGSVRSHGSQGSEEAYGEAFMDEFEENPWLSATELESKEEGYESMSPPVPSSASGLEHCSEEDFEGLEGIYRFLEECDRVKGRY